MVSTARAAVAPSVSMSSFLRSPSATASSRSTRSPAKVMRPPSGTKCSSSWISRSLACMGPSARSCQNESQAYHFDSQFGRRKIGLHYKLLKTNVGQSWRPPCLLQGVQRMDAEIQEEQMATERWEIDSSHSSLHFSVRHLVIAKVRGSFARWSGTIQVPDGDFSKATVAVTIDASSIDTGVADRDAHLKSPDFFDAAQHAELRFVGKRVEPRSGAEIDVVGDLTIKGITREVVLRVEQHGQAKDPWGNVRAAFTAKTSIDRKDFGLTWNQVLETGGVMVGDRVDIEADIEAG